MPSAADFLAPADGADMAAARMRVAVWDGNAAEVARVAAAHPAVARSLDARRTPLTLAVLRGHAAVVRVLAGLLGEEGVNAADGDGWSALLYAAVLGDEAAVAALLDGGARLWPAAGTLRDGGQAPALLSGPQWSDAVARLVVERGVWPAGAGPKEAGTPLGYAAWAGQRGVARLLLERDGGASADVQGKSGNTPLLVVLKNNDTAMARLLVERGANVSACGGHSYSERHAPLCVALEKGNTEMARLLVERGASLEPLPFGNDGRVGEAPLCLALEKGNTEMARLLVERGASVQRPAVAKGRGLRTTPLCVAMEKGNMEMARLLVERGASLDVVVLRGQSAMRIACAKGNTEMVRLMVERGASLDPNPERNSYCYGAPFIDALRNGHAATAQFLMDSGCDIHSPGKYIRDSPMQCAAEAGLCDIVRQMLDRGLPVDGHNQHDGPTPLMCAAENHRAGVVRLLLERGANVAATYDDCGPRTALFMAMSMSRNVCPAASVEIALLLLERGASATAGHYEGRTALHGAASAGLAVVIEALLARGASINDRTDSGFTPLFLAAKGGHAEAVAALLRHGASVPASTTPRQPVTTVLQTACEAGSAKCVRLLLEHGATTMINAAGSPMKRPLDIACSGGHADVARLLVSFGACRPSDGMYASACGHWAALRVVRDAFGFPEKVCRAMPCASAVCARPGCACVHAAEHLGLPPSLINPACPHGQAWLRGELPAQVERHAVVSSMLSACAAMPEAVAQVAGDFCFGRPAPSRREESGSDAPGAKRPRTE